MGITFLLPTSIPDLGKANPALLNCHLLKIFEQYSFIYAIGGIPSGGTYFYFMLKSVQRCGV